jgi:hypothetical protein
MAGEQAKLIALDHRDAPAILRMLDLNQARHVSVSKEMR